MRILAAYLAFVARLLRPFSLCAHVGAIHGVIVGGMMGIFFKVHEHWVLGATEIFQFTLILALLAWAFMLVVLCGWERYTFRAVGVPTLVSALITSLFTVFLTNYLRMPLLAWAVGAVVGLVWGEALCRLCGLLSKSRLEKPNAMLR